MDKLAPINGVLITSLKQIYHPSGNIFHGIKRTDQGFKGFVEAYFSTINYKEIKAWKRHTKMTLNIVVPVGIIKFVLFDDRRDSETKGRYFEIELSQKNYFRLTVPPNIWIGFEGKGKDLNLLLNIANMEHDSLELERIKLGKLDYKWEKYE